MSNGKDKEIIKKVVISTLANPLIKSHLASNDNSPEYKNLISYQRLQAKQKQKDGPKIVRNTPK